MKRFKIFLLERDINDIKAKTKDVPPEIIDLLFSKIGDSKYLVPFARMYKKQPFDLDELSDIIIKLDIYKLDLGQYKAISAVKAAIDALIHSKGGDKSKQFEAYNPYDINDPEHNRKIKIPVNGVADFPLVWKVKNWKIYSPKSLKACQEYSPMKYIGWCTAGSNHYPSYASGDLYIFILGNEFMGQFYNSPQRTEFTKPSKEPKINGPAPQEPINLEEFMSTYPELTKFFRNELKILPKAQINFRGRTFSYTVNEDGDIVVETIDISDLQLTTLVDLPWNKEEYLIELRDKYYEINPI